MCICSGISAQSLYPGQYTGKLKVANAVQMKAEAFDLDEVKLLPGRFHDNMQRDSAWMMSVSADRLLHSFRTTAGVWAGLEGGYSSVRKLGGWESLDCELRGHTTGHVLSASAMMYASTGAICFKEKGDSLVAGLAQVQEAHGNGYIPVRRTWKNGDRIQVRYPMSLRLERLADDPSKAAVFYGPVLLAGRLGSEGFIGCQPDSDPEKHNDYYTYDYNIPEGLDVVLEINEADFQKSFRKVGPLDFVNEDGDHLSPLYDIHRERYVVYWNL